MRQTAIQQNKSAIRQKVRQLRQQISPQIAKKAAENLANNLCKQDCYLHAVRIAAFLSFDGELNTEPAINMILRDKSVCYLPKLRPNASNGLWFMPYNQRTKLQKNRFGIAEVDLPVNNAIAVSQLDIILLPLVAFDEQGRRLGMGGGYYDATLGHLATAKADNHKHQCPLLIGIAYELQKFKKLPTQSWDVPLDYVLTESSVYKFN